MHHFVSPSFLHKHKKTILPTALLSLGVTISLVAVILSQHSSTTQSTDHAAQASTPSFILESELRKAQDSIVTSKEIKKLVDQKLITDNEAEALLIRAVETESTNSTLPQSLQRGAVPNAQLDAQVLPIPTQNMTQPLGEDLLSEPDILLNDSQNTTGTESVLGVESSAATPSALFPMDKLPIDQVSLFNQYTNQNITDIPANFGVYAFQNLDDQLIFGISQDTPSLSDGAALFSYDGSTTKPLLNQGQNPLSEQGVHEIGIADETLVIPGTDPCCGDDWDAGNTYLYDKVSGQLTKYRYDETGAPLLPDVVHSLGTWYNQRTNELFLVTGNIDRSKYGSNCGNPETSADAACYGALYKSLDQGKTWELLLDSRTMTAEYSVLRFYSIVGDGRTMYMSVGDHNLVGHMYFSRDGGKTWSEVENGKTNNRQRLVMFNGNLVTSGFRSNEVLIIDRRGRATIYTIPFRLKYTFNMFAVHTDGYIYALDLDGGVFRSNTLRTWQKVAQFSNHELIGIGSWQAQNSIVLGARGANGGIWKLNVPKENRTPIAGVVLDPIINSYQEHDTFISLLEYEKKSFEIILENLAQNGRNELEWEIISIPEWMDPDDDDGDIRPRRREEIEVEIDATLLEPGDHPVTIQIATNDPDQPLIELLGLVHVSAVIPKEIVSPISDTPVSRTAVFDWKYGFAVEETQLIIGTQPGLDDIYRGPRVPSQTTYSEAISLPNETQTLHARLISIPDTRDQRFWKYDDEILHTKRTVTTLAHTDSSVTLDWSAIEPRDLEDKVTSLTGLTYSIHRGTTPYFTPTDANKIAETQQLNYVDTVTPNPNLGYYYQIITNFILDDEEQISLKVGDTVGFYTYELQADHILTIQPPFELMPFLSNRSFEKYHNLDNTYQLIWFPETQTFGTYFGPIGLFYYNYPIVPHTPLALQSASQQYQLVTITGIVPQIAPEPYQLQTGYNFIGIHPLFLDYYSTVASSFGKSFLPNVSEVITLDGPSGQPSTVLTYNTNSWIGQDFPVLFGRGYFVNMIQPMNWEYLGQSLPSPTAVPTPTPTCQPRPDCLDAQPACNLPVPPGGWCVVESPSPSPFPSTSPSPSPTVIPTPSLAPTPTPQVSATLSLVKLLTETEVDEDTIEFDDVPAGNDLLYILTFAARSKNDKTSIVDSVESDYLTWSEQVRQCDAASLGEVSIWTSFGSPKKEFDLEIELDDDEGGRVAHLAIYSGLTESPEVTGFSSNTLGQAGACSGGSSTNVSTLNFGTILDTSHVVTANYAQGQSVIEHPTYLRQLGFDSDGKRREQASLAIFDAPESQNIHSSLFTTQFSGNSHWATAGIIINP